MILNLKRVISTSSSVSFAPSAVNCLNLDLQDFRINLIKKIIFLLLLYAKTQCPPWFAFDSDQADKINLHKPDTTKQPKANGVKTFQQSVIN